ncbi:MAG: hypothetical protein MUC28_03625 [Planctomycetes bacterium]|nr:hypothetical protein [Planctomycetota bacterium]
MGKLYRISAKKKLKLVEKKSSLVVCQSDGGRCNICGGTFAASEDICGLGQHQIGVRYPVNTRK